MEPNLDLVAQNPLIERNMNRIFDQEDFRDGLKETQDGHFLMLA